MPNEPLRLIRLSFDVLSFAPSWLYESSRFISKECCIFAWKDISEKERQRISHSHSQGHFPSFLNPLYHEETIHIDTSLGLLYRDEIIGWCLTRQKDSRTLCYERFYTHPVYKRYSIALLAESIKKQKALLIPDAFFELDLLHSDLSWRHFVKKRLLPLCSNIEHNIKK